MLHSRHEHETCVPGPAQLIRRRFQKAGPNLGRAHGEKEAAAVEEDRAEQSEAKKPEDNLLDQEDSDTQLLQKVSLKKRIFISGLCFVRTMEENIERIQFYLLYCNCFHAN